MPRYKIPVTVLVDSHSAADARQYVEYAMRGLVDKEPDGVETRIVQALPHIGPDQMQEVGENEQPVVGYVAGQIFHVKAVFEVYAESAGDAVALPYWVAADDIPHTRGALLAFCYSSTLTAKPY